MAEYEEYDYSLYQQEQEQEQNSRFRTRTIAEELELKKQRYDTSHLPQIDQLGQLVTDDESLQELSHFIHLDTLYILGEFDIAQEALKRYYESIRPELPPKVQAKNSFVFAPAMVNQQKYIYDPEKGTITLEQPPTEQAAEGGHRVPEMPQGGKEGKENEKTAKVYYDTETGITADFSGKKPRFTKGDKGDEPIDAKEIFTLIKRRKEAEDPRFTENFPLRTTTSGGEPITFEIPHPKRTHYTEFEYLIYTGVSADFSGEQPVFSAGTHPLSTSDVYAHIQQKIKEGDPRYVSYFNKTQYTDDEHRQKINFVIQNPAGTRVIEYVFPSQQPKADPNNEYIGSVALLDALVNAKEGIRLHSTPDTQDNDYQLKQGIASKVYPQGTQVTIIGYGNEEHEGWALIQIVEDSGKTQTGWIEARYLKQNIPDPQAIFTKRKHEVKKGETLEKLLIQEYGATYDLKVGDDLRTIAEAFANLNKDNPGVYYTGEGGSWWRDLLDPSMKPARDLYQTIRIKQDHTVRLPSTEYIDDLKKAGKLSQRSDIHNLAIEFGKGSTGFLLGFNFGLLKGAYDTVTGLVKLIYQLFTGELYAMFKQLFSMSWDDVQKLFGKILGDFEKKWNAPNPYDKWFFRGQVLGQIVFEIALAILSAGGGLVKNLSRIEKLVPIINKFQSLKKVVITAAKSKLGKAEKLELDKSGIWGFVLRKFRGNLIKKADDVVNRFPDHINIEKLSDKLGRTKAFMEAIKMVKLREKDIDTFIKHLIKRADETKNLKGSNKVLLTNKNQVYNEFTQYFNKLIPSKISGDIKKFDEFAAALIKADPRQGAAIKGVMFENFVKIKLKFPKTPTFEKARLKT
ncbi:SH3 domain-containing protein, partial [Microscilla marina]